jgi:excisionase family DNA binding protein
MGSMSTTIREADDLLLTASPRSRAKYGAVNMESVEWLNTAEAAQHLRIKPRTLVLWARAGKVPGHRLSGNQRVTWRFLRQELDAMLEPSSAVPAEGRQH